MIEHRWRDPRDGQFWNVKSRILPAAMAIGNLERLPPAQPSRWQLTFWNDAHPVGMVTLNIYERGLAELTDGQMQMLLDRAIEAQPLPTDEQQDR